MMFWICYCKCFGLSASPITQFADQIRIRLISQLNKGVSRVFQNLPRYLNGKATPTSKILSSSVLFVNLDLNLNYLESSMLASGSSILY